MKTELMNINDMEFKVRIKIHNRNNIRTTIRKKSINISIPRFLPKEEIFKKVEKMKDWAKKEILDNPQKFKQEPIKNYYDGQEIIIGGERYILKFKYLDKSGSSARVKGNSILLSISSNLSNIQKSKHISTLISRCMARKMLPKVKKRIEELNNLHFQEEIKKIFLKYNRSNWGSCSSKGNINVSTRLLFAPLPVQDYLFIHELAHLIESNHSDKFWALVEKAMPDYRERQNWLKENGGNCSF